MALYWVGFIVSDSNGVCVCVCVCVLKATFWCAPRLTGSADAPGHMLPGAFATHS